MSNLVNSFNAIIEEQDTLIERIFSYYKNYQAIINQKTKIKHAIKKAEPQLINDDKMLHQNWRTITEEYKTDILTIIKANSQTQIIPHDVNNNNVNASTDLTTTNNNQAINLGKYNQIMNNFPFIKKILAIITNKDQNLRKSFVLNAEGNLPIIDLLFIVLLMAHAPKKDFTDYDHKIITLFLQHGLNPNLENQFGYSILFYAAKHGNLKLIKIYLAAGADINGKDQNSNTVLIYAYYFKQDAILKYLLTQPNINVNIKGKNGNSIWMLAIADWRVPIIELLLDTKTDIINNKDLRGLSALMIATIARDKNKIDYLLQKGADPNLFDHDGSTALMYAIAINAPVTKLSSNNEAAALLDLEEQDLTIVKLLLDKKNNTNVNMQDKNGDTALIYAIEKKRLKTINYLLQNGADPNKTDNNGRSSLTLAIEKQHIVILNCLLENGADPHHRDHKKTTTLMTAADQGNLIVFNQLLQKQVDLIATDESGNSALMFAAQNGHLTIIKTIVTLLEFNAKSQINMQNAYGHTALYIAAQNGHDQIVNYLLQMGADPDIGDNNYQVIPLITAVHNGHALVIQKLLEFAKNNISYSPTMLNSALIQAVKNGRAAVIQSLLPFTTNPENNSYPTTMLTTTNLIQTVKNKHSVIVEMLIDAGANINSKDNEGLSALMWAVKANNFKMVQYLVKKGIDPNRTDNNGNSALIFAINQDNGQISQFLLENGIDITITNNLGKNAFAIAKERRATIVKAKIINQDQKTINHKIIELLRKKHQLLNNETNAKTNEPIVALRNVVTTFTISESSNPSNKTDYLHFKKNPTRILKKPPKINQQNHEIVMSDSKKENTKVTGAIAKKPHQTDQQNLLVIAAEKQAINKKAIKDSQIQAQLQIERAKQHEKLIKIQQELAQINRQAELAKTNNEPPPPSTEAIKQAIQELVENDAKRIAVAKHINGKIFIIKRSEKQDHEKGRPGIFVGVHNNNNEILMLLGYSKPNSNYETCFAAKINKDKITYFWEFAWVKKPENLSEILNNNDYLWKEKVIKTDIIVKDKGDVKQQIATAILIDSLKNLSIINTKNAFVKNNGAKFNKNNSVNVFLTKKQQNLAKAEKFSIKMSDSKANNAKLKQNPIPLPSNRKIKNTISY